MQRDARIDAYIKKAAPFARPILTRLREVVHVGCPEVEETLKWGHPSFMTYESFPESKKRDYVDWLTGAKTDATRAKRLDTAVTWMAEGKSRNWKYENC